MKKLTILAFMFMSVVGQSQNFKFGKISKEELKETSHPNHPEANAVVLFKKQYTSFPFNNEDGFTQETRYHERIKIYNKEGYDWAIKKISLYDVSNTSQQKIEGLKGYTYTLVDGEIQKDKLRNENIFEKRTSKYYTSCTFTMPGLSEGCVIEFEYSIKSPFLSIEDVVLQYQIPINQIEVDIITPEFYNYNKVVNPKSSFLPKINESQKVRDEKILTKQRTVAKTSTTKFSESNLAFKENVVSVYMEDIPALKEEPFIDNLNNYRALIAFEYAFYRGPDLKIKSVATSWERVTETIYNDEDFGGQLNKKRYFEEAVDAVIAKATSDDEKILLIFNLVKSKVKFNDYIGFIAENGVKKAFKEGTGNVADINLMLVAMLRYAGINANPVLVSTKDNGVPLFPTRSGFNYVICAVEAQDSVLLLDASSRFTKPNIIPEYVINWQGRLIREDGSSTWISLSPSVQSKDIVSASVQINADLSMEGKLRKALTAYQALSYRNNKAGLTNESLVQSIEKGNAGLVVSDLEVKNVNNVYKPIMQSYNFTLDGAVEDIAGNLYISPLLFLTSEENPFTQDSRAYPVDFVCPLSDKYIVNIDIPEGYQLESLPESEAINFNTDALTFSYLTKQIGDKIQIVVNLEINNTYILPSDYTNFKEFYKIMTDKKAEKIVLKKQ
ncbi:DUF3857 domain-containing protein [Olleya namhaensis]|uniref:transglutaminase domain-containing protein n=1 Tax=Olleya namhaensis TaxID=1144750 RepID=UPI0024920F87|nr:DUF3857 domain-containing protein [Olleya namhaensis]